MGVLLPDNKAIVQMQLTRSRLVDPYWRVWKYTDVCPRGFQTPPASLVVALLGVTEARGFRALAEQFVYRN